MVAVLWAGSCGVAYIKGKTHAENAAKAAYADALDDALANARKTAEIDTRLAVAEAEKRQKVRIEFRDKVTTVEKIIRENPTNCPLPVGYRLRVNEAIDAANSATATEPRAMSAGDKGGK